MALSVFAQSEAAVEDWYVRGVGPYLAHLPNVMSQLVPVSLAELLIVTLVLAALSMIGWGLRALLRGHRPTVRQLGRFGLVVVAAGLWLADGFSLVWGLSYDRPSVEVRWGWDEEEPTIGTEELVELAAILVDEVNDRYLDLHRAPDGFVATPLPTDWSTVDAAIDRGFVSLQAAEDLNPDLARSRGPAKRIGLSWVMSWLRIGGFYFPFTAEANVNRGPPDWQQPFTMAHEKAHQRFVASENEANFYGFLACIHSDDPFVQYAGYLFAQRQVLRALQRSDPIGFVEQIRRRLPGVQRDVNTAYAFWTGYESPVGNVSRSINDAYLKANGVAGGVQSYGRSLQLIVRYARQHHGRWPPAARPVREEM